MQYSYIYCRDIKKDRRDESTVCCQFLVVQSARSRAAAITRGERIKRKSFFRTAAERGEKICLDAAAAEGAVSLKSVSKHF